MQCSVYQGKFLSSTIQVKVQYELTAPSAMIFQEDVSRLTYRAIVDQTGHWAVEKVSTSHCTNMSGLTVRDIAAVITQRLAQSYR